MVARLTDAFTRSTREDRDPVVPAGGAATGVSLLKILLPAPLQIGQSGTNMVSSCAEAHQLVNWHNLGHERTESGRGERGKVHQVENLNIAIHSVVP